MVLLTAAMAALSLAIGSAWRRVERQSRLLAETDPLTGIANRRIFYEHLEQLAAVDAQPFAILMLDLDDFKSLNDEYGHQRGDEVLVQVAGILRDNVRAEDLLARYGGEEFIVAMPEASLEEAATVAERLRAAVAESTPTSVSIGCAVRAFGEVPDDVIRRADGLLLEAKRDRQELRLGIPSGRGLTPPATVPVALSAQAPPPKDLAGRESPAESRRRAPRRAPATPAGTPAG